MAEESVRQTAIASNYEAFASLLPLLLQDHAGQYALMRDREIAGFFSSASAAHHAGISQFGDNRFSVQKVEHKAIDLGFYSYARYRRVA